MTTSEDDGESVEGTAVVLLTSVEDGCEPPPAVPEGLPFISMYMKRPASLLPHFSAGKPGQSL